MDIIQQLQDLKEWSQNRSRYERRMNFRNGQLVQPGPGRLGFKDAGLVDSMKIRFDLGDDIVEKLNTLMEVEYPKSNSPEVIQKRIDDFAIEFKKITNRLPVPNEIRGFGASSTTATSTKKAKYMKEGINFMEETDEMKKTKRIDVVGTEIEQKILNLSKDPKYIKEDGTPNIKKLAKDIYPDRKLDDARKQIRNTLKRTIDYEGKKNIPGEITSAKQSKKNARENIKLAQKKAGIETTKQADQVIDKILSQNEIYQNMSVEDIAKDKDLLKRLRLGIDPVTGDVTFDGYTKKSPVRGKVFTDLELAQHAKNKAETYELFAPDHITPKALRKQNVGYPINFQPATYIENSHFDNARKYLQANPDGNIQAIDNYLASNNQTIRFGENAKYKFGFKLPIKFNPETGTSNIVELSLKKTIPKATKISIPAGSSRVASVAGVLDDALKTKTAKKVGSFLTKAGAPLEAGFIVTDYYNNIKNGMAPEKAWQTALSNATFGIYEGGSRAREKELANLAQAQGYSDWQVDSLKTMMSFHKLQSEIKNEKGKLKWLMAEQESGVGSITGEDVAGAVEQQKNLISKMEQGAADLTETYWKGMPEGEDFDTSKMFDDLLGYQSRTDYNRVVEDRKNRVNPEMGEIGSPLWEALSDWRTFLPQNLMETTQATQPVVRNLRKLPGILGSMWNPTSEQAVLSAMTPEEREERALRLNIKKQTYDPVHQTSTMTYDQMEPYYGNFGYMYNMAGGGIAGVRRPNAIPPKSGPMPQGGGLSSQFNRVKKLQG
jgi:hypothetical protein